MGILGRVYIGRVLTGVDGGSPPYREGNVSRGTIILVRQSINRLFRLNPNKQIRLNLNNLFVVLIGTG
jgi:hypothetical protein